MNANVDPARLRRLEMTMALRDRLPGIRQHVARLRDDIDGKLGQDTVHVSADAALIDLRTSLGTDQEMRDAEAHSAQACVTEARAEVVNLTARIAAFNEALVQDLRGVEMLVRERQAEEAVHMRARDATIANATMLRIDEELAQARRRVALADEELARHVAAA